MECDQDFGIIEKSKKKEECHKRNSYSLKNKMMNYFSLYIFLEQQHKNVNICILSFSDLNFCIALEL
jgi:hypothetical protein